MDIKEYCLTIESNYHTYQLIYRGNENVIINRGDISIQFPRDILEKFIEMIR